MPSDQLRRLLCLILPWAQIGSGILPRLGIGRSVAEMSVVSQTPVIPAGYAFSIWGPIFALSVAYGIWQFLPAQRGSALARRTGWPLAGVFAANALWQVTAQFSSGNGFHLVGIILVSLGCALTALVLSRGVAETGAGPRWIVAPLVGLMAGWLTAASFANISGASRAIGLVPANGFGATAAAVVLLLAAGGTAAALVSMLRGGAGWFAGAVGWAFLAIVVANLGVNALNPFAAAAAGVMLALVVAAAWQGRAGSAR